MVKDIFPLKSQVQSLHITFNQNRLEFLCPTLPTPMLTFSQNNQCNNYKFASFFFEIVQNTAPVTKGQFLNVPKIRHQPLSESSISPAVNVGYYMDLAIIKIFLYIQLYCLLWSSLYTFPATRYIVVFKSHRLRHRLQSNSSKISLNIFYEIKRYIFRRVVDKGYKT